MIPNISTASRRLRHLLGIDKAVGFTVLARSWSILSGALTVLLIARYLSVTEQGYYFTFSSLVSMQVVFELGFSFVILQLAAHESPQLQIQAGGQITGDEVAHSRLASILQKSVRWYSVAAVLMGIALAGAGFHFFSTHRQSSDFLAWKLPWFCIVLAVMFTFQMDPVFSFLEGCGFVAQVARMRLTQAVAGTALAWLALTHHRGLFAPAGLITGQAVAGFVFLFSKRSLLVPLLQRETTRNAVKWRTEIWPLQWRLGASFFCSYFMIPLFNPFLFAYRGAAEAGRMGMSSSIACALGTVSLGWMSTKASPFGRMIALRDYSTLDRIFLRTLIQSAILLATAEAAVWGVFAVGGRYFPRFASRLLPMPVFALLLFTIFLTHIQFSETLYLRAHKREPFLLLNFAVALLASVSTLVTSKLWGAVGVTVGFFLCGGVINLAGGTYIFLRFRKKWHSHERDPAVLP